MKANKLPVTCPLCGRKNEFPLSVLVEGYVLQCPQCNVKLTLHGHMWQEIQSEIDRMRREEQNTSES